MMLSRSQAIRLLKSGKFNEVAESDDGFAHGSHNERQCYVSFILPYNKTLYYITQAEGCKELAYSESRYRWYDHLLAFVTDDYFWGRNKDVFSSTKNVIKELKKSLGKKNVRDIYADYFVISARFSRKYSGISQGIEMLNTIERYAKMSLTRAITKDNKKYYLVVDKKWIYNNVVFSTFLQIIRNHKNEHVPTVDKLKTMMKNVNEVFGIENSVFIDQNHGMKYFFGFNGERSGKYLYEGYGNFKALVVCSKRLEKLKKGK